MTSPQEPTSQTSAQPAKAPWFRLRRWQKWALLAFALGCFAVLLPLILMVTYGHYDHRQKADAIVVFGAAVWPGNRPSVALYDRVMTGIQLYKEGQAPLLILTGGPSDTPDLLHETIVMRDLALANGVPLEDIVMDPEGVNTHCSVESTARICGYREIDSVLAVSHFYHLPRIQMAYGRAGIDCHTVPAEESQTLLKLPYYMAREVAAWWYYLLRPLWE